MKNLFKNFYKPTPVKLRKLGDALLGVFSLLSTCAILVNYPRFALVTLIVGAIGKFLTDFFSSDDSNDQH